MSSPTTASVPPAAPFEVYSVHFQFPGDAIELRNPATNLALGASPEWVAGVRDEMAAFVRGTRPHMRVVFRGAPAADGIYTIGADGVPIQVEERPVTLTFDPGTNLSNPEVFRASGALPDQIGVHATKLDWYVREQPAPSHCPPAGTSTHRICTTWRAMTPLPLQGLQRWVYKPLMEWTCAWAAGQDDEKDICDAIIAGSRASRLRYGEPLRVRDVRNVLLNQGGMCGEWYHVFQQMAHCQGVFVHRRAFLVHWREDAATGEARWCAIVVCRGGMNQPHPTHGESDFHDSDVAYPAGNQVPVVARRAQRYQFFGSPGNYDDGHCINFLEYRGRLFLYDASFGVGPIEIEAPLPVPDLNSPVGGAALASFKERYLDDAVDYMLGSIDNVDRFYRCSDPRPGVLGENGMTVRTRIIPETANGDDCLTFLWTAD